MSGKGLFKYKKQKGSSLSVCYDAKKKFFLSNLFFTYFTTNKRVDKTKNSRV